MKSKEYEYSYTKEGFEISDERKSELTKEMNDRVRRGGVAHFQILDIVQDDAELDFLYNWLDSKGLEIKGINGTLSGEIDKVLHLIH